MSEHSTRLRELSCSSYARKVCDEAADEIERLQQRIEELEKESEWKAMKQLLCADYHIITTDKIRAAWDQTHNTASNGVYARGAENALKELNIVRCERCADPLVLEAPKNCPDCAEWGSEGWVIKCSNEA